MTSLYRVWRLRTYLRKCGFDPCFGNLVGTFHLMTTAWWYGVTITPARRGARLPAFSAPPSRYTDQEDGRFIVLRDKLRHYVG